MKNYYLLCLALVLSVFSCRKDSDITTTNTQNDQPTIIVTGNLLGQIIDSDGAVVSNALIKVGTQSTFTDERGFYRFDDLKMDANGAYITADLDGYFQGSDRIYPQKGSTNFSRIQLLPKIQAGSFNNAAGGTVNVSASGAKVVFAPNSLVDGQGNLVSGEIQVYAQWLDPSADNLGDFMPGALVGQNTEGQAVTMTSMGMMAVELYDQSNNEVFIAEDKEATLQFPVPASLLAIAPSTIPLWHFDEEEGIWIEEGSASLNGNTYTGSVKHFTFWNVDFPYGTETIDISGCVEFEDGTPATYQSFKVRVEGGGIIIFGQTDSEGQFYGPIPVDETFVFEFFNECGELQEFVVGPFTEDTDLEECFILNLSDPVTLSGQLVDCDGQGVNEGVIFLDNYWPWSIIITDEEGNFSYEFDGGCIPTDISLTAFDYDNSYATDTLITSVSGDVNIGVLNVCAVELEEILSSDADGLLFDFYDLTLNVDIDIYPPDSTHVFTGSQIYSWGVGQDGSTHYITLTTSSIDVGTYSGSSTAFYYQYYSPIPGGPSFRLECMEPCNTITINITNNEGPGGFLEGNYSGTSDGFDNMNNPTFDKPVSGTFSVRIPD